MRINLPRGTFYDSAGVILHNGYFEATAAAAVVVVVVAVVEIICERFVRSNGITDMPD